MSDTNEKPTPGPWRSFESGSDGARILPDYGDIRERAKYIAIVNGRDVSTDFANAKLIAAAPDLLDAAKTVLARTDHTNIHTTLEDMRETFELLRVAIDKAEGR